MLRLLYTLYTIARFSLKSQQELALENSGLRQQLAILQPKTKRPQLTKTDPLRFKPKDVPGYPFAVYAAGFLVSTQFDLGPLNFDFSYTINMNKVTKTDFRTNSHVFKLLLGWLF